MNCELEDSSIPRNVHMTANVYMTTHYNVHIIANHDVYTITNRKIIIHFAGIARSPNIDRSIVSWSKKHGNYDKAMTKMEKDIEKDNMNNKFCMITWILSQKLNINIKFIIKELFLLL